MTRRLNCSEFWNLAARSVRRESFGYRQILARVVEAGNQLPDLVLAIEALDATLAAGGEEMKEWLMWIILWLQDRKDEWRKRESRNTER